MFTWLKSLCILPAIKLSLYYDYSFFYNSEISGDKVSDNDDDILHQQINNQPHCTVKGLVDSPSYDSMQSNDLLVSHDNKLVDWTRDKSNCALSGDWSHGAKWFRSSAVILHHHK